MDRYFAAFIDAGIHTDMIAFTRHAHMDQFAGGWQEIVLRVFGIDADFERMPVDGQFVLRFWKTLAIGNA